MGSNLDWKVGILRARTGSFTYGEEFNFVVTVLPQQDGTVKLEGAHGTMTPSIWRSINQLLFDHGYHTALFIRADGRSKRIEISQPRTATNVHQALL